MKKAILSFAIIMLAFGSINAQSVKLKKGKVLIDKQECLNYSSDFWLRASEISTLDGSQTIVIKLIEIGKKPNGVSEGYAKVSFVEQKKSLTTTKFYSISHTTILVKTLLANKVIENCAVNEDMIDKFIMKYDENIEETIIRNR